MPTEGLLTLASIVDARVIYLTIFNYWFSIYRTTRTSGVATGRTRPDVDDEVGREVIWMG